MGWAGIEQQHGIGCSASPGSWLLSLEASHALFGAAAPSLLQHETELTCEIVIVGFGPFNAGGGGKPGLRAEPKFFLLTREHVFGGRNIEGAETSNRVFAS